MGKHISRADKQEALKRGNQYYIKNDYKRAVEAFSEVSL